jgi:hypothetical protein
VLLFQNAGGVINCDNACLLYDKQPYDFLSFFEGGNTDTYILAWFCP